MAYQIASATTTIRINAASDAWATLMDGGYIDIYTTAQPTNPQTAIGAQVLLASIGPLDTPAFGDSVAGVVTAEPIAAVAAVATGTAAWYRAYKSNHTTVVEDGTLSTTSGTIVMDSLTFTSGLDVTITAFTHTES